MFDFCFVTLVVPKRWNVHKCSGASGENIFRCFSFGTNIIILSIFDIGRCLGFKFWWANRGYCFPSLSSLLHGELSGTCLCYSGSVFICHYHSRISIFLYSCHSGVPTRYTEGKRGVGNGLCFLYSLPGWLFILVYCAWISYTVQSVTTKPLGYNADGWLSLITTWWSNLFG